MTAHNLTLTMDGQGGTFHLDGHDLTRSVARDGVTITTEDGLVKADVRLLADALNFSVTEGRVTVHLTREQVALLRAGGWAKSSDVAVHADLLAGQASIARAIARNVESDHPDQAKGLAELADRLDAYVNPAEVKA